MRLHRDAGKAPGRQEMKSLEGEDWSTLSEEEADYGA